PFRRGSDVLTCMNGMAWPTTCGLRGAGADGDVSSDLARGSGPDELHDDAVARPSTTTAARRADSWMRYRSITSPMFVEDESSDHRFRLARTRSRGDVTRAFAW